MRPSVSSTRTLGDVLEARSVLSFAWSSGDRDAMAGFGAGGGVVAVTGFGAVADFDCVVGADGGGGREGVTVRVGAAAAVSATATSFDWSVFFGALTVATSLPLLDSSMVEGCWVDDDCTFGWVVSGCGLKVDCCRGWGCQPRSSDSDVEALSSPTPTPMVSDAFRSAMIRSKAFSLRS